MGSNGCGNFLWKVKNTNGDLIFIWADNVKIVEGCLVLSSAELDNKCCICPRVLEIRDEHKCFRW